MPKLPVVKPQELVRALNRLGFFEHRQCGTSHLVMKHPDGRRAIIAMHYGQDVPNGTLRGILHDLQISVQQIIEALR